MSRPLPDAVRAECVRLRVERQLSTPTIARIVGICNYSAYGILRGHPWNPPKDRDNRQVTRGRRWTETDVAFLRTAWPAQTREAIMVRLPGRSWDQIGKMANMSGFKRRSLAINPPKRDVHPLCQQLRRAREFQGLSRPELAERIRHPVGTIHQWECGKALPHLPHLLDWVAGLGFELTLEPIAQQFEAAA